MLLQGGYSYIGTGNIWVLFTVGSLDSSPKQSWPWCHMVMHGITAVMMADGVGKKWESKTRQSDHATTQPKS